MGKGSGSGIRIVDTSPKTRAGPLTCVIVNVLGLVFLGVGIGVGLWTGGTVLRYWESAEWERVPATIQHFNVEEEDYRDRDGHRRKQYRLTVRYRYEYGGKTYQGETIDRSGGTSSTANPRSRSTLLRDRMQSGQPIRAWVNPEDPSESMLFRELSTEDYILPGLALLFGLAGLGITVLGLSLTVKVLARRRRASLHPDKPWRHEDQWRGFQIQSASAGSLVAGWMGVILAAVFISIFTFVMIREDAPWFARIVVGLLGLGVVIGILAMIYKTLQYLKWGRATFAFNHMPFRPGEPLTGVVLCGRLIDAGEGFSLRLLRAEDVITRSGKNRSVRKRECWSDTQTVTQDMAEEEGAGGTAIPVRMEVPADQPGTEDWGKTGRYWQLEVEARTAGINFSARFDVPIYEVEDESLIEYRPGAERE